ncbi:MAG TPA: DUF3379 family protein [Steroidobacteraceae bacterium]|nr:DUF3379 family protein [Steroidobacteraceae bacterium]
MMDCIRCRQSLLADPHDADPHLREHLAGCGECSRYAEELLRFESRLERALRLPLPDSAQRPDAAVVPLRAKSAPRAAGHRKGWLAMAASVLLALVVGGALWLSVPDRSLAAAVVTHMAEEPQAWRRTELPVPTPELREVLRNSHLRLAGGAGIVSYASSCQFRGHRVPHLVIQSESGPVTVMVLVHEPVAAPVNFDEQGYRGVIVPVTGHGSLAVLTRGAADAATVGHIAARVLASIVWTG